MQRQELIELVRDMAYSGEEYHVILKKLERSTLDKEDFRSAKAKIDPFIVEYQLAEQERSKALNKMLIGGTLLGLSLFITLYTYYIAYNRYFLWYGGILAGAWIFKEGYKKYRLPIEALVPRRQRFKRKQIKRNHEKTRFPNHTNPGKLSGQTGAKPPPDATQPLGATECLGNQF